MNDNRFRWRTNPAVVAQYYTGEQLPSSIEAHLKPNEACAVFENGALVGVATSTKLTINPELGTLAKLLKRRSPMRSFLFAFLGPHEVLVPLNGTWSDGAKALGMAGLKIQLKAEELGRLMNLPAKGKTTISLGDLASEIQYEISNKFASGHVASVTQHAAQTDAATATLMESGLRTIATSALSDLGASLDRVWVSWTPSQHDRLLNMRNDLEMMVQQNDIVNEQNRLAMEQMLHQEVLVLEREHQLRVAGTEYQAKAAAASEIAEIRVKAEKETERWKLLTKKDELMAQHRLRQEELNAEHKDVVATLRHGNEMRDLDRTMDLEDKMDELERRRRQRKMARANEEAEFLRQQEAKAEAHNQRMLKGVFDAMDGDDTE